MMSFHSAQATGGHLPSPRRDGSEDLHYDFSKKAFGKKGEKFYQIRFTP